MDRERSGAGATADGGASVAGGADGGAGALNLKGESDDAPVVGLGTKPPVLVADDGEDDGLGNALPPNVSAVVDALGGAGAAGVGGADGAVKANAGAAGVTLTAAAAGASVFAYSSA